MTAGQQHVCNTPGCPNLTAGRHCARCSPRSARNHRRIPRQAREHGAGYDAIARSLAGLPCEMRLPGCTGIASGGDLIVPRAFGGRAVRENMRPGCAHCQSAQGAAMVRVR